MASVSQLNKFKKLFNTYGKRSLKNYGINVNADIHLGNDNSIIVKITGKVPPVVKVNDNWDEFRYDTTKRIITGVLGDIAELLEMPKTDINLWTSPILHDTYGSYNLSKDVNDWNRTAFDENREMRVSPLFFYVHDGTYVISKRSAISYPVSNSHEIYGEDGFHLPDIENQDWWDSLDNDDKDELITYFG